LTGFENTWFIPDWIALLTKACSEWPVVAIIKGCGIPLE
jgi:hypothetical protein